MCSSFSFARLCVCVCVSLFFFHSITPCFLLILYILSTLFHFYAYLSIPACYYLPPSTHIDPFIYPCSVINDERVKIRVIDELDPAPVSDPNHEAYKTICVAVHQTFQDSCSIVPGVFVANSDSRHYWNISPQIYRFNPITLHASEVNMFHGFNERIRILDYAKLIVFWRNLVILNDARLVSKDQRVKTLQTKHTHTDPKDIKKD